MALLVDGIDSIRHSTLSARYGWKRLSLTRQDGVPRDPEDRIIDEHREQDVREKMLDKTIADTFPASDPPSSIPNPTGDSFEKESDDIA